MRTFLRGKAKLLVLALGVLLAVQAIALADIIKDQVVTNSDSSIGQVRNYTAGSAATSITYWIQANGPDIGSTNDNCDAADGTPVTVTPYVSGYPAGASQSDVTISPSSQAFDGCASGANDANAKAFSFSTAANVTPGRYTIDVHYSDASDPSGNDYQTNVATFFLDVSAPTGSGGGGGGGGGDPCANVTVAAPAFANTTPTYGNNGWFNQDDGVPTVSASSTGNTVTYATDASGPFGAAPTLSDGQTTVYAKATDANGCSSTVSSHLYKVDTVDPGITDQGPTSLPTGTDANNDEWYNHSVTNQFEAQDPTPGSGFASPNANPYTISVPSTGEGRGITLASGQVSDVAGNAAASINSAPFNIDLTPPLLNVSGAAGGTSDVCSIPSRPSYAPSDALSGLDGSQGDSWSTPPPENGGIGAYTYSAHAKDYATNSSSETRTYTVVPDLNYTDTAGPFSGILQPVNLTGTRSSFKLGSTVPIKFRMMCGTTPVTGLKVSLWLSRVDGTADPVNEAVATTTGTTGTLFRYDATSQQYIFNLATKGDYVDPAGNTLAMGQGTWYLSLLFAGTNQKVQVASIDLRK